LSEHQGGLEFSWAAKPETDTFDHEPVLVARTCGPANLLGFLNLVGTARCNDARRCHPCPWHSQGVLVEVIGLIRTALSEHPGGLEFSWAAKPETDTFDYEPVLVARTCGPANLLGFLNLVGTPRCNDARRCHPCPWHSQGVLVEVIGLIREEVICSRAIVFCAAGGLASY
jgi:hypothetical protein